MLAIRSILVPIDFSSGSEHALAVARSLARDHHAQLVLFAVAVPSQATMDTRLPAEADQFATGSAWPHAENVFRMQLATLAHGLTDVPVETDVRSGPPGEQIVAAAERHGIDLIVMGTHGRTGLSRLLLGSVAEYVLRHAPCPVLTIKPGAAAHLSQQPCSPSVP